MFKISDQELIKHAFSNVDYFATLDTTNTLFLLETLNKKLLELKINAYSKVVEGNDIDFNLSRRCFLDLFNSLHIQPNSIRVKVEASYLYTPNCTFLWQATEKNYVTKRNIDSITALATRGILALDPIKQLESKDSYLVSEFINQPVLICLPKKIKIPLSYADKHFKVGTRESEKYILLLKKLWKTPQLVKNTNPLYSTCVLLDLTLQRLYTLKANNPDNYLSNVISYFNDNVIDNPITITHPLNLILGYIFKLDKLKKDERNQFLLELAYTKNSLAQVKGCLEKYGVTLINETLPGLGKPH